MQVDRGYVDRMLRHCNDYIHKDNPSRMRERYSILTNDGEFYNIEGNTSGWSLVDISGFAASVAWVEAT